MKVYGWIPHLDPDLSTCFDDIPVILRDKADIPCDDTSADSKISIVKRDSRYSDVGSVPVWVLDYSLSYGGFTLDLSVELEITGLISFSVVGDSDGLPTPASHDDSVPNGTLSADERRIRYMIREIYFEIKRTLHSDVHHPIDSRSDSLSGPDEMLSVTHGNAGREQAIVEISRALLRKIGTIDAELGRQTTKKVGWFSWKDTEYIIHARYNMAIGFIAYAAHFADLFLQGDVKAGYLRSLELYRSSIDGLYQSHCNDDIHHLTGRMNSYTLFMLAFTAVNVLVVVYQVLR